MASYTLASFFLIAASVGMFLVLLFVDAPYGKRDRDGWGPALPVRWAWFLLEVPSFILPLWLVSRAGSAPGWPASILLLLWLGHYFYRSFIYPQTLRPKPGKGFKLIVLLLGAPVNVLISAMMATMLLSEVHLQELNWLSSPQFVLGVLLCLAGFVMTTWSDVSLRRLRLPGDSRYYIPRGGLYRYVSCPNYLGEILQWSGFALACWSTAGLAFALYTTANLLPRALTSHRWYREQFVDYPARRKALIPGLL